jgi:hypothetical protein
MHDLQVMLFQDMYNTYLNKVPVLAPLPPVAVFALAKRWERVIHLPQDVIVAEGGLIEAIYFVVRGTVNMSCRLTYRRYVGICPSTVLLSRLLSRLQ